MAWLWRCLEDSRPLAVGHWREGKFTGYAVKWCILVVLERVRHVVITGDRPARRCGCKNIFATEKCAGRAIFHVSRAGGYVGLVRH